MKFLVRAVRGGCLWVLLAMLSGSLQAQGEVDASQRRLAMQLITDSYMLRFYSYLGDDYLNFSGTQGINEHREGATNAARALVAATGSTELEEAWQGYDQALKAFVGNWRQQQYPDWYSLQDLYKGHRVLLELLQRNYEKGEGGEVFAVNLALLDMIEYYMHLNTEVYQAHRHPRGIEYDMAKEAVAFEKRLLPLVESKRIDSFSGLRWKFIKPLFENYEMEAAPMTLLRHGGGLAESLGAG
ncbi:hypothetical protein D0544_09760 [Aestuariirhabdus litorea]|uniref:DUF885 family protein n=2 Tax=Aestuariirhabdus litorea TaxID=2528527 RepID=A0A3P3VXA5_9GAMM|nr:hypothetical protein D0544_09760 [Aestuariirhabdus litorea]